MTQVNNPLIEQRTIEPIPDNERHGRPRDLFTTWFAYNGELVAVFVGALATATFGLPLVVGLLALLIGLFIGGTLMSLHSAQGAKLGLPQLLQSRAQFGSQGAVLFVVITIVMYIGFGSSALAVAGQAMQVSLGNSVSSLVGIVIAGGIGTLVAGLGYRYVHILGKVITVLTVLFVGVAIVWLFAMEDVRNQIFASGAFNAVGFFATIAVAATWLLAFGPYCSDYSRYMPASMAGRRSTFWATLTGGMSGAILPMTFGAALGIVVANGDLLGAVPELYPLWFAVPFLFIGSIVLAHGNAMNVYGAVICTITLGQTFKRDWLPGSRTRILLSIVFGLLFAILAWAMSDDIMGVFQMFITVLMYALIPWSAVNLVDFYLYRHGDYDIKSIMSESGGIYGRFNWPALIAFALGAIAQIPFMSLSFYVGPIAEALQGVDVAWVVGFLVAGGLYIPLRKMLRSEPDALKSEMQPLNEMS